MKIVFFGSDDFAVTNLEKLIASSYDVIACVTQPDRAGGRGMKVQISLLKELAQKHRIPVLQPNDIRDVSFAEQLRGFDADLFVVIAYGRILPSVILDIPRLCAINVHGSLLPAYRGAAPINWAIIKGDTETGVSVIKMNAAMDAGDVILQERMAIQPEDTAATLRVKMAQLSAASLCRAIDALGTGDISLQKQDEGNVSFAPKITKTLGGIDWQKPAEEIHNLVRGLLPYPAAYTFYQGKRLKVLETQVLFGEGCIGELGAVLDIRPEGIVVRCGKEALLVKRVHLESSKSMDAKSFVAGHNLRRGALFQ